MEYLVERKPYMVDPTHRTVEEWSDRNFDSVETGFYLDLPNAAGITGFAQTIAFLSIAWGGWRWRRNSSRLLKSIWMSLTLSAMSMSQVMTVGVRVVW